MSSEFVGYAPEIETIDPHLDEALAQIIGFVEKKNRESPTTEGAGRAVRAAHAKSFGLVKAEVEILADVPAAYAQGIYATPGRHRALIRFSSTSGHLGTDAQLGSGLGFEIKMFDNGNFMDLGEERDPNVGLQEDAATFTIPHHPVRRRIHDIPTFNVLRGGEYFFMPSLSALRWLGETSVG